MKVVLSLVYVAAICAANFSVHLFGPIVTPLNAFLLIGLDFVIRDKLHEQIGVLSILILIAVAGFISYAINPATDLIAFASVASFALANTVDAFTYQSLINRPWLIKSNGSNVVSSAVDSMVFPLIAFGMFMPWVIAGQFFAKVCGGALWAWMLRGIK